MKHWRVLIVALALLLGVGVWAAVTAGRREAARREEQRVPILPTPPEVVAAANDPENAYPEYFAIRQSHARFLLDRSDEINESSWVPGPDLAKLLTEVRPELERAFAATRRKRCDLVLGVQSQPKEMDPGITGLTRRLLVEEGRRRRAVGSIEGAADCVIAILRIARQVRSHEDRMSFVICMSTSKIACKEAAIVLGAGAFTEPQRREAIEIIDFLLAAPLREGATDLDQTSHRTTTESLRALRDRLSPPEKK